MELRSFAHIFLFLKYFLFAHMVLTYYIFALSFDFQLRQRREIQGGSRGSCNQSENVIRYVMGRNHRISRQILTLSLVFVHSNIVVIPQGNAWWLRTVCSQVGYQNLRHFAPGSPQYFHSAMAFNCINETTYNPSCSTNGQIQWSWVVYDNSYLCFYLS